MHRAYPGALAYKMSKAAMDQLTRCSALEVFSFGLVFKKVAKEIKQVVVVVLALF